MSRSKNVNNLIMSVLPDNRPVTSLQIVEDPEKYPKNFVPIHRSYDQDADADLGRDSKIIFGKRSGRYLCLSKTEGLPDYIVETLMVISERELPPDGFSLLTRTADTEQKAWRKRQIAYKLSKRGVVTQAVTDIILCSKLKVAPEGFIMAGEINGIVICFKLGNVTHRPPPLIPPKLGSIAHVQNSLHYINISTKPLYPLPPTKQSHDYEEIRPSYQLPSPIHAAPRPPITKDGTISGHTDIDGVPFIINPKLTRPDFQMPNINVTLPIEHIEYNFQLERQILCTTKSNTTSTNPFFH